METRAKWQERVSAWKASGQSAREFSEGKEYKASTLLWWAGQLSRQSQPMRMARVVRSTAAETTETGVTIQAGALCVSVRRGFDRDVLREVLSMLGGQR
jgi:uncharacterized protein YggE